MKCDSCLYTNTCDGWCIGYVPDAETSKADEDYKDMVADVKLEAKSCENEAKSCELEAKSCENEAKSCENDND